MRSHRGILSVVALIAALGLSACGSAGSSAGAPTYTDLVDRVFIDSTTQPPIEMTFLADSFAVNAGCNTLAGGATITDGVFTLDGPLASTKMACEESLMQRDDELAQFLASSPTVTLDGATLTMTSGDSSFTFVESAQ